MKRTITLLHSREFDFEVLKEPSPYCTGDIVYFVPDNVSLQDYALEYKIEIAILKNRYRYLEKARDWIIRNIRGKQ